MRRNRHATNSRWTQAIKAVFYMLLMGILTAWAVILARPLFLSVGLSERTIFKLPKYGFVIGLGLGLAIALAPSVKEFFIAALGALIFAGLMWLIGVVVEALLIEFGFDPDSVDWISTALFWAGGLLVLFPIAIIAKEGLEKRLERFQRSK
ncbi:MAG: hypothetical protein ABI823_03155 [Bryobacteraceae bacterium]